MQVGKYLIEKCGFHSEEVIKDFCDKFGYTERMFRKILADVYPLLLTTHLLDISHYTKIPFDTLNKLQEYDPYDSIHAGKGGTVGINDWAPYGKPYRTDSPAMGVLNQSILNGWSKDSPFISGLDVNDDPGNTHHVGNNHASESTD